MKYFLKKAVSAGLSFLMACTVCLPVSAEIPQGSLMFSAEDTKQVRQQKTEYNRAYAILFSILASSAAYAPEKGIERTYLRDHGWRTSYSCTDDHSACSSNHHDPVIHADGTCTGSTTDEPVEFSIDHVGIPEGIKVLQQYAVVDREALDASDHSPIYADVEF